MRRIPAQYPRALFALAIIGAVLILGAASCGPVETPAPKRTVRFIGDSITWQSAASTHAHYDTTYDVTVLGVVGATTWVDSNLVALDAQAAPNIEVINLGTNDAHVMPIQPGHWEPPGTLDDTLARLSQFAAEFPSSTCVVWVTVNDHNPSWNPANADRINDLLRTFPHVADWATAYDPADYAYVDNPHPNAVGQQHLLQVEDQAIATCP